MRSLRPHDSGVLQKIKNTKPNSDYGLHKHFAVLPIAISLMAIGNTQSEWKHNINTMLSFSQHAKFI